MSRPFKKNVRTNSFAYKYNREYRKSISAINDKKTKEKVK